MNWQEVWKTAYELILLENPEAAELSFWLENVQFLRCVETPYGNSIELTVPTSFYVTWIESRYRELIERSLSTVLKQKTQIDLLIRETVPDPSLKESAFDPLSPPDPVEQIPATLSSSVVPQKPLLTYQSGRDFLDPNLIFESFVVGISNQFAHASALASAEKPAYQFNPLFIHGPPGVGKTHLLHAIGNHILAKYPQTRVHFVSAETFVNELVEAIQHQKASEFRSKYRNGFDVLLFDDIQFLAGKNRSEEEFVHTFNTLYNSKRQLVLTSDKHPDEIEGIEERTRTRLQMGLVADVKPPEIETRIAILRSKAEQDDIYLPDEVATFLGTYVKGSVRALHGVLVALQAQASLTGTEISLELAKSQLKATVPDDGDQFTVETIQNAVAKYYKIKIQDLKNSGRARMYALPRQVAIYLIRKYTALGLREIGLQFGGKDHSTIMHAYQKISIQLDSDPDLKRSVEAIREQL